MRLQIKPNLLKTHHLNVTLSQAFTLLLSVLGLFCYCFTVCSSYAL